MGAVSVVGSLGQLRPGGIEQHGALPHQQVARTMQSHTCASVS